MERALVHIQEMLMQPIRWSLSLRSVISPPRPDCKLLTFRSNQSVTNLWNLPVLIIPQVVARQRRGTQIADRRWESLDRYVPPTLAAKLHGDVNGALAEYVYSWVWRTWLNEDADLVKEFGLLCDAHRTLGWTTGR